MCSPCDVAASGGVDLCHCLTMPPEQVCDNCPYHGGWEEGHLCPACAATKPSHDGTESEAISG